MNTKPAQRGRPVTRDFSDIDSDGTYYKAPTKKNRAAIRAAVSRWSKKYSVEIGVQERLDKAGNKIGVLVYLKSEKPLGSATR